MADEKQRAKVDPGRSWESRGHDEEANATHDTQEGFDGQGQAGTASFWKELPPEIASDPTDPIVHKSKRLSGWQLFGASRRGKSHAHAGTYREDAFQMIVSGPKSSVRWWAFAVADGAGSRPLSRVGANLAVKSVCSYLRKAELKRQVPDRLVNQSAVTALEALKSEADRRECSIDDLACTLLVLLWIMDKEDSGGLSATFQAGDGLIAYTDECGSLTQLATEDYVAFAGSAHFFTSQHVQETWDVRFGCHYFEQSPAGFLVMTDGVADDLIPYKTNGPILVEELFAARDSADPSETLAVDLLAYEKRGSFDDRTLACGLRLDRAFRKKDKL